MSLTESERLDLNFEKMKKGIKSKDIARAIGLSEPSISLYFKNKMNLVEDNEQKLIQFISSF